MSRIFLSFLVLPLLMLDGQANWWVRRRRSCSRRNCSVSAWTSWTACNRACGFTGTRYRTRTVTRGASCGGACPYGLRETATCNRKHCPVNGGWSRLSVSTPCTVTCGSGKEVLSRSCSNPAPRYGGRPCQGSARTTRVCIRNPCPVHGGWSSWSVSTPCSVTCGNGKQVLSRTCSNPAPKYGGRPCRGTARKEEVCTKRPCPIDGGWSSWGGWTTCTKTCESGTQARTRSCTNPPSQHGGKACPGAPREERVCNTHSCPVHGGWSSWSVSTSCSVTCGNGMQVLSRTCTNPSPKYGGRPCQGDAQRSEACTRIACPIHGGWSSWSLSTPCSVSCGTGVEVFSRSCTNPSPAHGGRPCQGDAGKEQACTMKPCPIDGRWSSWGAWTTCTKTCGSGTQSRTRSCTQPAPQYGGKTCPGAPKEERVCNMHSCPVHGGWSSWSVSTPCSVTCGSRMQLLSRTCTDPAPKYGGRSCQGDAQREEVCSKKPCPISGGWSSWNEWSSCSRSCGNGNQERFRTCTEPVPSYGGKSCPGAAQEKQSCNRQPCPVDGGWSSWGGWTTCTKTCDSGRKARMRNCTQPLPQNGGKTCPGTAMEYRICNNHSCPVDGGWSGWSSWLSCGKTCGGGSRERGRSCTNPSPLFGGKPCQGATSEDEMCNKQPCPVDGAWSDWNGWTSCNKSCGTGFRERSRNCTQPSPSSGGKPCPGEAQENHECNAHPCPVDGGWSDWSSWTECSVTCGTGDMSRERKCDNPPQAAGGKPCQGYASEVKSCNATQLCIGRVGCYGNFPSSLLGDFRDEIQWASVTPFRKQMEKMVEKCAQLALKQGIGFFAIEDFGNCYGAKYFSPGSQRKANRCNFGVGLANFFYIYKVSM